MEALASPHGAVASRGGAAARRGRAAGSNTCAGTAVASACRARQAPPASPGCAAWRERAVSAAACSPSGAAAPSGGALARRARLPSRAPPRAALSSAAAAALAPHAEEPASELYSPLDLESLHNDGLVDKDETAVPLYVMLPLDTVTILNTLNHVKALHAGLRALRSVGVDGVAVDVWWGVVEAKGPRQYDWSAYRQLVRMVAAAGLKLQVVLSFHACGCNVGDSCTVSLPPWVLEVAQRNPDVLFTDRAGARSDEYLSLGCDELPLFQGRSPVECYRDFMDAFRDEFEPYLGTVIPVVAVSMGPAGELRYPSYPEGRWTFPGVGAFQCYDRYMLANLRACAVAAGQPEWGHGGPHDAGEYCSRPEQTGFFREEGGSWASPYGEFFMAWYAGALAAHGDRVLGAAAAAFDGTGARIMGKLPGVHWWFKTRAHAAEAAAGLYNPSNRNGYAPLLAAFARHGAMLDFTCAEMRDGELHAADAACGPEALLAQVRWTAAQMGVPVAAENALPRFDATAHEQIVRNVYHDGAALPPLAAFTYLRMSERLFAPQNWHAFVAFVRRMAFSGGRGGDDAARPLPARRPSAAAALAAAAAGEPSPAFEMLLARAVASRRTTAPGGVMQPNATSR